MSAPSAGGLDLIPGLGIRSFIFYAETEDPAFHNEVLVWPPPQKKIRCWSLELGDGYCICSHSVVSNSLMSPWTVPASLLCPWDFPGKNTGVGCHFLLQGIFLTQGLNLHLLCLLSCRWILYHWAPWVPMLLYFLLKYRFLFFFFYNVVLIFAMQLIFSYICILFHDGLSQDMEYSSLCYRDSRSL